MFWRKYRIYRASNRKPEGKRSLGKPRRGWEYIKTDFQGRWEEGRELDSSGLGRGQEVGICEQCNEIMSCVQC